MIITANTAYIAGTWRDWYLQVVVPRMTMDGLSPQGRSFHESDILMAEVIRGEWIITCPNRDCGRRELAFEERWFMCLLCYNSQANHCVLPTSFPADRKAIDRLLDFRPEPNRNWDHHESVADLQIENIEHDVLVPTEVS